MKFNLGEKKIGIVKPLFIFFCFLFFQTTISAQHSVARQWNEVLLDAIRVDFARPTVHARNLFHTSVALYDSWAAYTKAGDPYFLGNTISGFTCPFDGINIPADIKAAQEEAMSYAAFRLLVHRFQNSPGAFESLPKFSALFTSLGYDPSFQSVDYVNGPPAALGNYIASMIINFGLQDSANEDSDYTNLFYDPSNDPLIPILPGNPDITNPNNWQPLTLDVFIDQAGNVIPINTPEFLSPEWGTVPGFALKAEDLTIYEKEGNEYWVYHDPGKPPYIDFVNPEGESAEYNWGFSLVSVWSSHLDPSDGVMIDISPASIGNIQDYPTTLEGLRDFYDIIEGGDPGNGHDLNPVTGLPYEANMVPRADYGRVLAEFWADGPDSETPPGHWFTILNYVIDHPLFVPKFEGNGPDLDALEYDVKAYLMLAGAVHDSAITAWGIKGWYDYIRPISAIRFMADQGQSTDPDLPNYDAAGIMLIPGYIELVEAGDPLAGANDENVNKIKLYAWKGPDFIDDPDTDVAGVDWILAENWWPYQRPSFITPPFAGYISGHSTFSSAAAEVMELLTGDPFFPGGMGEFIAEKNEFLVFEDGPSVDVVLQWATYKDASDQTSLSRIWGGIHPPVDDIPGRIIGETIGIDAFNLARSYFHFDNDADGYYDFEDCNDNDPDINPASAEVCDGIDNDCNSLVDDGLTLHRYYLDIDNDEFGDPNQFIDTCLMVPPTGFVTVEGDCNDNNQFINPNSAELCDDLDNNCDGMINEGLEIFTYFPDNDGDGFGTDVAILETCMSSPPTGFVADKTDCDDTNPNIFPGATELLENGIDEDCNGIDLYRERFFPNPVSNELTIHYNYSGALNVHIISTDGKTIAIYKDAFIEHVAMIDMSNLVQGLYFVELLDDNDERIATERIMVSR